MPPHIRVFGVLQRDDYEQWIAVLIYTHTEEEARRILTDAYPDLVLDQDYFYFCELSGLVHSQYSATKGGISKPVDYHQLVECWGILYYEEELNKPTPKKERKLWTPHSQNSSRN